MKCKPFKYENFEQLEIQELKLELDATKKELKEAKKIVKQLLMQDAEISRLVNEIAGQLGEEAI